MRALIPSSRGSTISGMGSEMDQIAARLERIEQRLDALERRIRAGESPDTTPGDPMHMPVAALPDAAPPVPQPPSVVESPAAPIEPPPAEVPVQRPRDLEARIGGDWLNRLGIAAVLFGVAYLLRYMAERGWLGPQLRIVIGVGAGAAFLAWAESLHRKGHVPFAHAMRVLGVGVLFLSTWAASELYGLIPPGVAFVALVAVTAGMVALAVRHSSPFIASLALSGGYLAPLILSSGIGQMYALFAWLLLLGIAMLVLVALRGWPQLSLVAVSGTTLVLLAWYGRVDVNDIRQPATVFATLLFVLFLLVPLVVRRTGPSASLVILPLLNPAIYVAQIFDWWSGTQAVSWFVVLIAACYATAAAMAARRGLDRTVVDVQRFVAVAFVVVLAPIHFDGIAAANVWALQGMVMLMVGRAAADRFLRIAGGLTLALAVLGLMVTDIYSAALPLLNARTLGWALVFSTLLLAARAARADSVGTRALTVVSGLLVLRYLTVELMDMLSDLAAGRLARAFALSALWIGYGAVLVVIGFRIENRTIRWLALAILGVTAAKVFVYDLAQLDRIYRIASFLLTGAILLAISFAYQRRWINPGPPG